MAQQQLNDDIRTLDDYRSHQRQLWENRQQNQVRFGAAPMPPPRPALNTPTRQATYARLRGLRQNCQRLERQNNLVAAGDVVDGPEPVDPGATTEDETDEQEDEEPVPFNPVKKYYQIRMKKKEYLKKFAEEEPAEDFIWARFRLHPLQIPNVMTIVLNYLKDDVAELKKCRKVCKVWAEEVRRLIPTMGKVSLVSFEALVDFIKLNGGAAEKFSRFRLGPNLNLQDPRAVTFFTKFGPHMKFLHLDFTWWIPAALRRTLTEKLPVLEELIICSPRLTEDIRLLAPLRPGDPKRTLLPNMRILRLEGDFQSHNCKILFDLLSIMPNLTIVSEYSTSRVKYVTEAPNLAKVEKLRYEMSDTYTDTVMEIPGPELITSKILFRYRDKVQLPRLENLRFVFDMDVLTFLNSKHYPLKYLEVLIPGITFLSWHPRPSHLYNFIAQAASTLQALKISYSSSRPRLFAPFDGISRLKSLRHLTLHRVTGNLEILNHLPQLRSLHMTQEDFLEYYDEFHISEGQPHKLTSFKLYYTHWSASSVYSELPRTGKTLNVVEVIVQRFPRLTSFRMESLTNNALKVIYNFLPQLEELEATNGHFTSAGISGISLLTDDLYVGNVRMRKPNSIGCLEGLKKLTLQSNKMTDEGILSGVSKLSQLQELSLLGYKLTDDSLTKIVNFMNLKLLKTEFCYEFTPELIEWAKVNLESRGSKAILNPFCSTLEHEAIHDFLNENGPIHVSIPDFPVMN